MRTQSFTAMFGRLLLSVIMYCILVYVNNLVRLLSVFRMTARLVIPRVYNELAVFAVFGA
jgi:hypothetical protein